MDDSGDEPDEPEPATTRSTRRASTASSKSKKGRSSVRLSNASTMAMGKKGKGRAKAVESEDEDEDDGTAPMAIDDPPTPPAKASATKARKRASSGTRGVPASAGYGAAASGVAGRRLSSNTFKAPDTPRASPGARKGPSNPFQSPVALKGIRKTPHTPGTGRKGVSFAPNLTHQEGDADDILDGIDDLDDEDLPPAQPGSPRSIIRSTGMPLPTHLPYDDQRDHGSNGFPGVISKQRQAFRGKTPAMGKPFVDDKLLYPKTGGPTREQTNMLEGSFGLKHWVAIGAAVVLSFYFFSAPKNVPFCNTDGTPPLSAVSGDCVICPPHGVCSQGHLRCDYMYTPSHGQCVKDTELTRGAHALGDYVLVKAQERRGYYECGSVDSDELSEDVVRALASSTGVVSADRFAEAWELMLTPSVFDTLGGGAVHYTKAADSSRGGSFRTDIASKTYRCLMQEALLDNIALIILIVGAGGGIWIVQRRRAASVRVEEEVEELMQEVHRSLQELFEQTNGGQDGDAGIAVTHLRDSLIPATEARKELLWSQVEARVAKDTRIDEVPRLLDGQQIEAWVWTAPLTPLQRSARRASEQAAGSPMMSAGSRADPELYARGFGMASAATAAGASMGQARMRRGGLSPNHQLYPTS